MHTTHGHIIKDELEYKDGKWVTTCKCHCHSETEETKKLGLQCRCIKNCPHCHPENFCISCNSDQKTNKSI